MNIRKLHNGLRIYVTSQEIENYFLQLALKQIKNKKPYRHGTAYLRDFRIDVAFIKVPSKKETDKRKFMLERAKKITLTEFIKDFRATATEENQRVISRFCNVFKYHFEESLFSLIKTCREQNLPSGKGSDLFEQFVKSKGFEFATWNGQEYI